MLEAKNTFYNYPDWYKLESETSKTIKKLSSLNELDIYLKNSDEFIRRLAILRLGELKLKDSVIVLEDILEDRSESAANKELAAWAMKSVSVKCNIDLFTTNHLLARYTGNESLNDIIKISVLDSAPNFRFQLSSAQSVDQILTGNDNARQYQDTQFDSPFPMEEWRKALIDGYKSKTVKALKSIPSLLIKTFGRVLSYIFRELPSKVLSVTRRKSVRSHTRSSQESSITGIGRENYRNYYTDYNKKPGPSLKIKNFLLNVLVVLFFPVRMFLKHKKAVFLLLAAVYCFFAFTLYGRDITCKYFGFDLSQLQSNAYKSSKQFLQYSWRELNDILGTTTQAAAKSVEPVQEGSTKVTGKKLIVIAKTGLNLRKEPDASSGKVTEKSLDYNSIVYFASDQAKDSSGGLWYHISTPEGISGWAYSKWLKEVGGEQ
jgi:hypothetical protein